MSATDEMLFSFLLTIGVLFLGAAIAFVVLILLMHWASQ